MRSPASASSVPVVAALGFVALLAPSLAAQYPMYERPSRAVMQLPWENNRVRLSHIAVPAGAPLPAAGNRVLVYLTAGPDGRMPAEAVWQPAGAGAVQNAGSNRVEAIAIELKDVPAGPSSGTPLEAIDPEPTVTVTSLINNERVLVAKHRYEPASAGGPPHFHPEDVLLVYLRGGYTWPLTSYWGATPVRRGEVEVIPANTFHRLGNAGSDPLELLVIVPK
jgi:quercetin dioxygenase-like cupin family protein